MTPNTTFKSLNFSPFIVNNSLNDNSQDLDVDFFHDNVSPLDTDYISPSFFNRDFKDFVENSSSVLHISIMTLDKNLDHLESISVEIGNNDTKNIYCPPDGDLEVCEKHFSNILSNVILVGDFNINVLELEQNKKVQYFLNSMFQFGLVPTINKPTRVKSKRISAIDHITKFSL